MHSLKCCLTLYVKRHKNDGLMLRIPTGYINTISGKGGAEPAPINIDGAVVERVESFKFLGVYIPNELSWSKTCQDSHEEGATKTIFQPSGD